MTSTFLVGEFPANGPADRERGFTPTRPDALPPGTRLDEYELGPLLGDSPLGLVYLATDHSLGRKVAIREYLPTALSGRGEGPLVALRSADLAEAYRRGLRAFVEEARLLARFDDPSLLRVLRFWEAHFTAYVVMPYYDAPSLTAARERLAVPPAEPWIRSLLESLANALELLHGESCLHRNVTPDRVLMLRDGRPLLLGPSAVRQVLGRETHTTLIQPGFSAIEEYAESSDLPQGPWTDVYALGALARFCILGIAPVAATVRSVRDPLVGMQDALFPLRVQWPELTYSRGLLLAIDSALAVDPAHRPQSMAEFRALLNPAPPASPMWAPGMSAGVDAIFDPTRPEPDLNLLSATDLETADFEASLSAMVDEALLDAPPMRTARAAPDPEPSKPPVEASIVRAAAAALATGTPASRGAAQPAGARLDAQAVDTAEDRLLSVDLPMEAALDDPSFHATGDRTPFRPAGRPRWQRRLTGVAAVLLIGAFGYVGWSQYQRLQAEEQTAARVPMSALPASESVLSSVSSSASVPGAASEAEARAASASTVAPDPIAEARLHPPSAGTAVDTAAATPPASEASTADRAATNIASDTATAAAAPVVPEPTTTTPAAEPAPAPTPARTARLARAAQHEARIERATVEPRAVCGSRTDFALYRCMQTQCDKPQYAGHAQCRQFKLQDRVE